MRRGPYRLCVRSDCVAHIFVLAAEQLQIEQLGEIRPPRAFRSPDGSGPDAGSEFATLRTPTNGSGRLISADFGTNDSRWGEGNSEAILSRHSIQK